MTTGCPHKNIAFCPLYHAMHIPHGPSCDDGKLGYDGCGVARKMKYERLVEQLRVKRPGLVEHLQFLEEEEERKAQSEPCKRPRGLLH